MELKYLLNSQSDIVTIHDNNFNIIRANNVAKKILELPSLSGRSAKCYKYYHGTDSPPANCPSSKCLKEGIHTVTELHEPHLKRDLEIRAMPRFDNKKRITGVIHIVRDITFRKNAEEELVKTCKELRMLSTHLQSEREEERRRMACEIHDELAQRLTALKIDLTRLGRQFPEGKISLIRKLKSMSEYIDSTISTVQKIVLELRPCLLDNLGLRDAIEWQAREFQKKTGIKCSVNFQSKSQIDSERSTAFFRIFQETHTNVARHSGATEVKTVFKENNGSLVMTVVDNGKGIGEEQVKNPKSFGLSGMKERAESLGGTFMITGNKNRGTTISICIPGK